MKKYQLTFLALKVPLDYTAIILAAITAYFLRYLDIITQWRPIIFDLPFKEYLVIASLVATLWIIIFAWFGLYQSRRQKFTEEFSKIIQGTTTGVMVLIVYMFFIREIFSSRFIILLGWLLSMFFVVSGRLLIRLIKYSLYKKGIEVQNTIIIGEGQAAEILAEVYQKSPNLGTKIIKILKPEPEIFEKLSNYKNIDEIIQADYLISRKISSKLIDYCLQNHIIFKYVGGDFESKVTKTDVHTIAGIPLIEVKRTPLAGWGKISKRLIDILGALIGLVISSPVMLITAIAIKLDSPGPVFADIPCRAGQYGQPFRFFKFRSMYAGAHKDQKKLKSERQGLFKIAADPRITRVGHFIRKTSIDEVPQFINVLLGQMSLVGPRPHFLNEYQGEQMRVLDIKPGLTGISQISGRSDLSFAEEIKLDNYYIENWSLWLDLWIIFKTPLILITKINSAV